MEPGGDESGEGRRGFWSNLTLCILTSSYECVCFLYSIKYYSFLLRGNLSGMAGLYGIWREGRRRRMEMGNFHQ